MAIQSYRYRFGEFILSPRRRLLVRGGAVVPLIPRYLDLLLLLVDAREGAVDRRTIFDRVWSDVVVSDGALSQAIRTLRRALGDDPRAPRFIRTVSRHGYQFVYHPVVAEADDAPPAGAPGAAAPREPQVVADGESPPPYEELLARLLGEGANQPQSEAERYEIAEQLHALGTAEALRRLDRRPGHARARAILRDARWNVSTAGDVPLVRAPGAPWAIAALLVLRLRRAARAALNRLAAASAGGIIAGSMAGLAGGLVLVAAPDSAAGSDVVAAIVIVGAVAGGVGAAGIGAGLAAAEAVARSGRRLALIALGAVSGLLTGAAARFAVRSLAAGVLGRELFGLGGPLEGLALGAAAGAGYALGTRTPTGGGMATPHGRARIRAGAVTGVCCGIAGAMLGASGGRLVAVTLDMIATTLRGSGAGLEALAYVLGEADVRPVMRTVISAFEGLMFGVGLAIGLTHRPSRRSHSP